jgi:hypothetical protein
MSKRFSSIVSLLFLLLLGGATFILSGQQSTGGGGGSSLPGGLYFTPPTLTISTIGAGNGALALSGNTSGAATFTAPAVAGTPTNPVVSSNVIGVPGVCDSATGTGCLTFAANLVSATGSGNPLVHSTNNTKAVGTSDFTSANASGLQAITGLSFPLGSTAQVFTFHCALMYSQATNVAGDQFGVAVITTAPTNVAASGEVWQNTTAGTSIPGVLATLSTTTPTAVVTFQPAVTGILRGTLDGTIETAGSGAATFNVYVTNGVAADVIVVKRGSYCTVF